MTYSAIRARLDTIDLVSSATSPLAASDNAPVGSRYFQTNGIPWIKTGTTVTAWAAQMLRAPYFNVVTYGADAAGVSDSRAAIQLAIDAARLAGGGVVFFPPGTYLCNAVSGVTGVFLFSGEAQGKVWMMGCGRSSRIHLNGDGQLTDKVLWHIRDGCKYVGFSNLYMKSTLTAGTEAEQQHLILFENRGASVDPLTGRSFLRDVAFGRVRGDALRFLGNNTNRVADIVCERLSFEMVSPVGQRSRSAFQFQRAVDDVTADCCYADDNSSAIDMEPTGVGTIERIRMHRCHFIGQVSLTGNGVGFEHVKSVFTNNCMVGAWEGLDIERLVFSNTITDHQSTTAVGEACLAFTERIHALSVVNCIFYRSGDTASLSPVSIDYHSVGENHEVNIRGCLVTNANNVGDGGCINLQDVSRSIVANCMMRLAVNVAAKGSLIRIEGTTEAIADLMVCNNMGKGTNAAVKQGVVFGGGNTVVNDNVFTGINAGVQIAAGRTEQYTVAHNILAGATSSINGNADYVCVDGNGNGSPSVYQVVAAAEGMCPGVIGSLAFRSTGGGAGTTMAVRETVPTSVTGWVLK